MLQFLQYLWNNCLALLILIFLTSNMIFSQDNKKQTFIETDYFYGTILEHSPKIGHLITGHPEGFMLQYNFKTFGEKEWERRHNYPDWGFTMALQNMKNKSLGEVYGVYSHISWYFLKRRLKLSIGQGIAYATRPYDSETNFRNIAYGSNLLSATFLKINYHIPNIWREIGLNAGISLFHNSNGNIKAPNAGTNTFAFNLGINYQTSFNSKIDYITKEKKEKYTEPIHLNFAMRFGINESDIGFGQYPFFIASAFADKRISKSSSVVLGSELFVSYFLKELINFRSIAFPDEGTSGDEDFKRVGVFAGYQLRINKLAPFVNLGYYVYQPYSFESRLYNRLGLKRYFTKDEKIFALISVKSHAARAEALELGVGYRF